MEPLTEEDLTPPKSADLRSKYETVEIPVDITWEIKGKKKKPGPYPQFVVPPKVSSDYGEDEDKYDEGFVDEDDDEGISDYPETPESVREEERLAEEDSLSDTEEILSPLPDEDVGEDADIDRAPREEYKFVFDKEEIKYWDVDEETKDEIIKILSQKRYKDVPERILKVLGLQKTQYNIPEKVFKLVKKRLTIRPVDVRFGYEGRKIGRQPKEKAEKIRREVAEAERKAREEGRPVGEARAKVLPGYGVPWPLPHPRKPIQPIGSIKERIPYKAYSPPPVKKAKVPLPPKKYSGDIRYGDRVEFSVEKPVKTLRGTVSGFSEEGFRIRGDDNKTYIIPYDRPPSKLRERSPYQLEETELSFYDFYSFPVTDELRKTVVNYIFDLTSQLVSGLTRAKKATPKVSPKPLRKSWEEYYQEQFRAWNYARLYPILIEDVSLLKCQKEAEDSFNSLSDPTFLLQDLSNRHGKDFFQPPGEATGKSMVEKLSQSKEFTIFDAVILSRLMKHELDKLKGSELARVLHLAVLDYLRKYPPSKERLYEECVRRAVHQRFLEYERVSKDIQEDKLLFDKENLAKLKELYQDYSKEFSKEKSPVNEEKLSKKDFEYVKRVGKLDLSRKGVEVHRQISEFEMIVYGLSDQGKTMFEYLRRVLIPTVFLNKHGNIGKYCKFFQAKISTGAFELRALTKANLAHYFPELVMRYVSKHPPEEANKELEEATDQIASQLLYEMNQNLEAFVYGNRSRYGKVRIPKFFIKEFYWKGYLSTPQEVCKKDTGSGFVKTKRLGPRRYREEPIPNEQLVVCYDPEVGFSCDSIPKIVENIVTGKGNPFTGKKYPKDFMVKMRERYPQLFKKEEELEARVEKEMELERIAIEEELKELKEWPKDIHRQYEILFGEHFEEPEEELPEEPEELPEEELSVEDLKKEKGKLLVFFTASWSDDGPTEEEWEDLKKAYPQIKFAKVDIEDEEEFSAKYGVTRVPLFILFQKGKPVERIEVWNSDLIENLISGGKHKIRTPKKVSEDDRIIPKLQEKAEEEKKRLGMQPLFIGKDKDGYFIALIVPQTGFLHLRYYNKNLKLKTTRPGSKSDLEDKSRVILFKF